MPRTLLTTETPQGAMRVHRFIPEGAAEGRLPGVMLLQEAFGVNGHIERVCERVAALGYAVFCPELFHRSGHGIVYSYEDFSQAREVLGKLTTEDILSDLKATHALMAADLAVEPSRIAAWGFCMGGWAAVLAASALPLTAAISFYGGGMVRPRKGIAFGPILDRIPRASCPTLLVFGAQDPSISAADVEAIREAFTSARKPHEVIVYPDGGHGFFCEDRGSYNKPTAEAAWSATVGWLKPLLAR